MEFFSNSNEKIAIAHLNIAEIQFFKDNRVQTSNHLKQSLEIFNRVNVSGNDFLTKHKSRVLHLLGFLTLTNADSENGIFYLKQAVEMRRHLYKSADNFDLAESLNNLGCCYLQKNDNASALLYLTEGMNMRKRLLDLTNTKFDHDLAQSLSDLKVAYFNTDLKKADTYTIAGLNMRSSLYKDKDNQHLATSLNNLGVVLLVKGEDLDSAEIYLSRGLEMRMRLFKGNHPDIIQSKENYQKLNYIRRQRFLVEFLKKDEKKRQVFDKFFDIKWILLE